MRTGDELMHDVRAAQEELGTGDVSVALHMVEPLLEETAEALRSPGFLAAGRHERALLLDAFFYARITAILALETAGAAGAPPRIRALVAEALEVASSSNAGWKVCCAGAEMLARAGDAEGARNAVEAAVRLAPEENYAIQLRGSIRSMFPAAFTKDRQ